VAHKKQMSFRAGRGAWPSALSKPRCWRLSERSEKRPVQAQVFSRKGQTTLDRIVRLSIYRQPGSVKTVIEKKSVTVGVATARASFALAVALNRVIKGVLQSLELRHMSPLHIYLSVGIDGEHPISFRTFFGSEGQGTPDRCNCSRCSPIRGNLCRRSQRLRAITLPHRPPLYQCSEGASLHALPGLSSTPSLKTRSGLLCRD
jgi:hypothetical protein